MPQVSLVLDRRKQLMKEPLYRGKIQRRVGSKHELESALACLEQWTIPLQERAKSLKGADLILDVSERNRGVSAVSYEDRKSLYEMPPSLRSVFSNKGVGRNYIQANVLVLGQVL